MTKLVLKTGSLPSPPDARDYQAAFYQKKTMTAPAGDILYSPDMTPVRYQDSLGSCVSHGTWGAFEYHEKGELLRWGSTLDLYWRSKLKDGMPSIEGTYPRVALQVLVDVGSCVEEMWPYSPTWPPDLTKRSTLADADARRHRLKSYARVGQEIYSIREALWQFGPLVIGMSLSENFMDTAADGIVPAPVPNQPYGHCMCIAGIFANNDLWIKNSWSTRWGKEGYCRFKWQYLDALDFYEVWSFIDADAVPRRWTDLAGIQMSQDDLLSMDAVWQKEIMRGYPDGTFRPSEYVTQHQVGAIMERLKLVPKNPWNDKKDWTTNPTRGFIHEQIPALRFEEERWTELLTRYQLMLLTGRSLRAAS